jgi:hypothetical protein
LLSCTDPVAYPIAHTITYTVPITIAHTNTTAEFDNYTITNTNSHARSIAASPRRVSAAL